MYHNLCDELKTNSFISKLLKEAFSFKSVYENKFVSFSKYCPNFKIAILNIFTNEKTKFFK